MTKTICSLTLSKVKGHVQARSKVKSSDINYVHDRYFRVLTLKKGNVTPKHQVGTRSVGQLEKQEKLVNVE